MNFKIHCFTKKPEKNSKALFLLQLFMSISEQEKKCFHAWMLHLINFSLLKEVQCADLNLSVKRQFNSIY